MKRIQIIGLALVAAFAFSAVAASAASAAAPEFLHAGKEVAKRKFKSTSGEGHLVAGPNIVTCKSDTDKGEIEKGGGNKKVTKVVVTFKKCSGKNGTETCKVKSVGAKGAEEIITKELVGELGKVAKAEAATETGLALQPKTGTVFVEIEGSCLTLSPAPIEGSVIGEVTPVKTETLKGNLEFKVEGGKQKIRKLEGGAEDVLKAFGFVEATEETSDVNTFEETVEVT